MLSIHHNLSGIVLIQLVSDQLPRFWAIYQELYILNRFHLMRSSSIAYCLLICMLPWHSWCYLTLMTSNMLSYSVDGTIYEHIIANSRLYLGVPVTNYVSLPYTYEVTVSGATCTVTPSQDYATVFMLSPTATNLTSFQAFMSLTYYLLVNYTIVKAQNISTHYPDSSIVTLDPSNRVLSQIALKTSLANSDSCYLQHANLVYVIDKNLPSQDTRCMKLSPPVPKQVCNPYCLIPTSKDTVSLKSQVGIGIIDVDSKSPWYIHKNMTGLPVDVDIVAIPVGQEVTTITVHTEGTVNFNIADYRNGLVTVSLDNCDTSMIYSWVQFSASWEVSDQQGKTTTRVVYKNKVKLFVSKTERFTFPLPLDAAKLSACLITFSDLPQSVTSWTIADIISMFPQQNNSSSQNGNNQGNGTTINDNKTQNNSNGNNTDAKIEVVSHLPTVALALIISGAVFALLFCCIAYCLVRRYRRKRKQAHQQCDPKWFQNGDGKIGRQENAANSKDIQPLQTTRETIDSAKTTATLEQLKTNETEERSTIDPQNKKICLQINDSQQAFNQQDETLQPKDRLRSAWQQQIQEIPLERPHRQDSNFTANNQQIILYQSIRVCSADNNQLYRMDQLGLEENRMIANDLIDLLALCRWKIIALYSLSQFEVIIKVKQATRGHSRNKVSPIAVIPAGTLLLPLNKLKQLQTLIVTRQHELQLASGITVHQISTMCYDREREIPNEMQPYTISAVRSRFYKEGMSQNDVWELTCKEGIVNFNLNNDSFKPIEENQIKISSISTKE